MNKIMAYILPMKNFAAMIFAGFIILYMVTGVLFGAMYNTDFDYKIPFSFVLQGLVLALVISCLWSILFHNKRKSRTFIRLIIFAVVLIGLVKIGALTLLSLSAQWVNLWIVVTAIVATGLIVIAILGELFFRKEGKRYTEKLKEYQANL